MENNMEIIESEVGVMTERPHGGGVLSADTDNILYLAERAEQYIAAMNRIMDAALKITNERDWCLIGGGVYLQETGASKIARLFGISIQLLGGVITDVDAKGYKTFTYKARFILKDQFVEAEGSRSMKDEFFSGKGCRKPPDEIDERDVKMAAYSNCLNNGIKRLIPGLRGLDVKALEKAGFNTSEIRGYTFKTSSQGGNSGKADDSGIVCEGCGAPITQKVAAFSQNKFGKALCMNCQKGTAQ